jgi:hypothetical protein
VLEALPGLKRSILASQQKIAPVIEVELVFGRTERVKSLAFFVPMQRKDLVIIRLNIFEVFNEWLWQTLAVNHTRTAAQALKKIKNVFKKKKNIKN